MEIEIDSIKKITKIQSDAKPNDLASMIKNEMVAFLMEGKHWLKEDDIYNVRMRIKNVDYDTVDFEFLDDDNSSVITGSSHENNIKKIITKDWLSKQMVD